MPLFFLKIRTSAGVASIRSRAFLPSAKNGSLSAGLAPPPAIAAKVRSSNLGA